jgi:hypothetical protein
LKMRRRAFKEIKPIDCKKCNAKTHYKFGRVNGT